MTVLFREITEGQSFREEGDKQVLMKIGPNQAITKEFDVLRYYPEDEIQLVSNPEDMLFLVSGSKVRELEG